MFFEYIDVEIIDFYIKVEFMIICLTLHKNYLITAKSADPNRNRAHKLKIGLLEESY